MKMTFRWYGDSDPVKLENIRQIPGMYGIVSAIYDIPVGEVWDKASIQAMVEKVEANGMKLECIESVPVHEDIKLGLPSRERYIENYCETIQNLSEYGIKVVCYNFMPVFDWMRSELDHKLPDGSSALIYDQQVVDSLNPLTSELSLPGWDSSYTKEGLRDLLNQYSAITEEKLWENLGYFLEKVVKVCDQTDVSMAIHPDDPPWSIFGLPRIITGKKSYQKLFDLVKSKHNGITLCSGSLGADPQNDIPALMREFGQRIHFLHLRNVLITGEHCFEESAHLSSCGSLDMYEIVKAAHEIGFEGYFRPDHGRMIWGETGRAGYGLYDRALGAVYINGLYEAIKKGDCQ